MCSCINECVLEQFRKNSGYIVLTSAVVRIECPLPAENILVSLVVMLRLLLLLLLPTKLPFCYFLTAVLAADLGDKILSPSINEVIIYVSWSGVARNMKRIIYFPPTFAQFYQTIGCYSILIKLFGNSIAFAFGPFSASCQ